MNAVQQYTPVDIAASLRQKKVRFHNAPPEVRVILESMETWRHGDIADAIPEEDVANADTLWRSAYALAAAQEEQDAADCFSTTRKRLARPATPGRRALLHQAVGTASHIVRKPVPSRALTMPMARVDSPLQAVSYRETPNLPRYERTLTDHSFNSFLDTKKLEDPGEDMHSRRASLHPFEHLATLTFRKAKKKGSKAVAFMEEKLREQQTKKR